MNSAAIFLIWIYVCGISFIYGFSFLNFFPRSNTENPNTTHFSVVVISGLALITCVASWTSLFYRINYEFSIALAIGAVILFRLNQPLLNQTFRSYLEELKRYPLGLKFILPLLTLVYALFLTSGSSLIYDDFLYYRQTIKWINEFSVIPGLGNLHGRLGFNSSWHLTHAVFNFSFLGKAYNDLNGLLAMLIGFFSITSLSGLLNGKTELKNFLGAFLIVPNYLFLSSLSAPSADVPATYFIWLCFVLFISFCSARNFHFVPPLILIASYTLTIKVSAAMIGLINLYFLISYLRNKDYRKMLIIISINILVLVPWFTRNVFLSGYLVYPFYQFDIFQFDWKVPVEQAIREADLIKGWARVPVEDSWRYAHAPAGEWIRKWLSRLKFTNIGILTVIIGTTLIGLILITIKFRKVVEWIGKRRRIAYAYLILYAGIVFWFVQGPNFRFGYGFLMFFCFLTLSLILKKLIELKPSVRNFFIYFVLFAQLLPYQQLLFRKKEFNKSEPVVKVKQVKVNNLIVNVPSETEQCGDAQLPCVNQLKDHLAMRGKSLQDGFKIQK